LLIVAVAVDVDAAKAGRLNDEVDRFGGEQRRKVDGRRSKTLNVG
jgi:hypothetical protein